MMQQVTHTAISGYRIKMQNCLIAWKGEGKNTITQDELCECMTCRVTSSFRKHISELQTDGVVTRFMYPTDNGGYRVAYLIN